MAGIGTQFFFLTVRAEPDLRERAAPVELAVNANMPPLFSAIVESGYAKYHELDDVYTLKGAYDLFDTYCIRAENRTRYEEYAKAEAEKKRPAQNRRR